MGGVFERYKALFYCGLLPYPHVDCRIGELEKYSCSYSVKLLKNVLVASLVSGRSCKTPVTADSNSNYVAIYTRVIEQMLLEGDPPLFAIW